jgi:GNAT superfamily N-acetyltransferase
VTIREIAPSDAAAAAQLSGEFGYPASKETMERRIQALQGRHDHAIFLACNENAAVAWIDVGIVHHLPSEPYGEIGGFVVSEKCRSMGLRRALVRSQVAREAAHRFYLREGYARVKTSAVFEKELSGPRFPSRNE